MQDFLTIQGVDIEPSVDRDLTETLLAPENDWETGARQSGRGRANTFAADGASLGEECTEARHDIIKGQVVKDGHFLLLGEFKDGQTSV